MKKHLRAVDILCSAISFAWIGLSAPFLCADAVDDYVNAEIAKRHIPGVSLAVVQNGQVVKQSAYGLANVELEVAATPQTVFQIQSITKTFTAAAILLLVEEGKLALEDPIGKRIEGAPEAWKDITIRHLLNHTSGIKDFINDATASLRLDVTEEEVLQATAPRPLNFAVGEKYAYSNTGYHLLAMVIRKITGKWYGDFLKERIFTPLGMSDTRVVSLSEIIPHRASGYHWSGNHWSDKTLVNGDYVAEPILAYGGGGILSTASDLAKWAVAFESEKLLKQTTIAQAWTPAALNGGKASSYGLGWSTESFNGHRHIGHSGGHITGFTSRLSIYPDDKLAVVVLTNSTSGNPGRIAQGVAGLYVPGLAPKRPSPIEDKEPEVTALLRYCILQAPDWKFEPEKFTPELWKAFTERKAVVQVMVKAMGQLKSIDLLSRGDSNGLRTYRYRTAFANGTIGIALSLAADGKITALTPEDE